VLSNELRFERAAYRTNESSRESIESPEGWRLESEAAWEAALSRLQSNMIESALCNRVNQIKARANNPWR
jgi:hypothetical protein